MTLEWGRVRLSSFMHILIFSKTTWGNNFKLTQCLGQIVFTSQLSDVVSYFRLAANHDVYFHSSSSHGLLITTERTSFESVDSFGKPDSFSVVQVIAEFCSLTSKWGYRSCVLHSPPTKSVGFLVADWYFGIKRFALLPQDPWAVIHRPSRSEAVVYLENGLT